MATRTQITRNDYRCSMERNQSGKYCVRIQVRYPRHAWTLGVYFLASSFDRAMKKLEECLDFLQRNEEKLLGLHLASPGLKLSTSVPVQAVLAGFPWMVTRSALAIRGEVTSELRSANTSS